MTVDREMFQFLEPSDGSLSWLGNFGGFALLSRGVP